jgi:hypothetical protein
MQSKIEILEGLTKEQREEFDNDVQSFITKAGMEFNFDSTKEARVKVNMRLKGDVFLYVVVLFNCDVHGRVRGDVETLIQFKTVDEYLDSINKENADTISKNIK